MKSYRFVGPEVHKGHLWVWIMFACETSAPLCRDPPDATEEELAVRRAQR